MRDKCGVVDSEPIEDNSRNNINWFMGMILMTLIAPYVALFVHTEKENQFFFLINEKKHQKKSY